MGTIFKAEPGKRRQHLAKLIGPNGEISPLCAKTPRAIRMGSESNETWTRDEAAVNCPACKRAIDKRDREREAAE